LALEMDKHDLAPAAKWARIDDYLDGLARRRTARRSRRERPRTEPEMPRLWLSTLPFAALMSVLAMLVVAIAVAAFPGSQPQFQPQPVAHEDGTAAPGWFEEAKKEMR
jgi:hypothetical protein